jgi:hypothetical protein
MEAVEYPVCYNNSCRNDSWYTYVHAYIHKVSNKPREWGVREKASGSIVRTRARFFVGGEGVCQSISNPTAPRSRPRRYQHQHRNHRNQKLSSGYESFVALCDYHHSPLSSRSPNDGFGAAAGAHEVDENLDLYRAPLLQVQVQVRTKAYRDSICAQRA